MTGTSRGRRAAIGFRAHSGWACAILLAGSKTAPDILDRRRVALYDPAIAGSKQPFHHAEPMPFARGEAFIARCTRSSDALASVALRELRTVAEKNGVEIATCGITTASGRPLPDLRSILASHTLIHAAEGEFNRDRLANACESAKVAVARVKERDVADWLAARLNLTDTALKTQLSVWGKALGPPWTADEKLATMAAWLALAG
ncbi:MAG TPA: hypothetical protein VGG10_15610 [Rhizomicrobium sp.]|jgi:hypothetical protein